MYCGTLQVDRLMKMSLTDVNLYEFSYSGHDNKAVFVFGSMYDGSVIGVLECLGVTSCTFSTIESRDDFEDPEYCFCSFIGEMRLTETPDKTYQLHLEGHNDINLTFSSYNWREFEKGSDNETVRRNIISSVAATALERVRAVLKREEA